MIILIIIFVFTKLITNPIKKLTVAAEVVSKGDYNIRIPVEKQDEIGRLSNSFNTMTQEIKHYTENLESLVDERTKALQLANDSLTTAKKKIVDSIEYAKLLQSSILPTQVELDDTFSEHFEIYEPLDIVGGDFYFLKKTDHDIWIASIDCTGHGVPGAFMTMMANVLLKDIIDMNPSVGPAKILEMFHYKLKESLKSKSKFEHLDNGLDMGLCKIIKDKSFIQFSGAGLPLIYSDRNEIIEVRGDSLHIGYDIKKDYTFTEHELKLAGNSSCYLITDGILDLPGGKKGFGLGRLRLLSILESVKNMPLKRQREEIRKQLEDYKGEFVKKDDLLFLGFRI